MKSRTIDISDKVYKVFRDFLEILHKGSFRIYDNDSDELTVEKNLLCHSKQNSKSNYIFSPKPNS